MVYKNFRLNCIIRLFLICVTIYLLFFLLFKTNLIATTILIGALSIYQIYNLFHFIERTNKNLTRFLESIRYSDFSQSFTSGLRGTAFDELNRAFNDVMKDFQRIRKEKEEHFRYLQTIVQHVNIGLIVFNRQGEVELINNAAKRKLQIHKLNNINELERNNKELAVLLSQIKPGERSLIKMSPKDGEIQLSISAAGFVMRQKKYMLISLQNIQSELEEKEMEAWQNLIRVLTHEIMNSIAPISSLASTAKSLLENGIVQADLDSENEVINDVSKAVRTIEKRSKGLINFVDNYRKLTRIPKPNFEIVPVSELFGRVKNLMEDQFEQHSIDFKIEITPETLEATVDPVLLEQVLINLCKNSVEAVIEIANPTIQLIALTDDESKPVIKVLDNGQGIKAEVIGKIFIPFFTTKKEGSGIGLSLSKQIMRLHQGTLSVSSRPDEETIFTLRF